VHKYARAVHGSIPSTAELLLSAQDSMKYNRQENAFLNIGVPTTYIFRVNSLMKPNELLHKKAIPMEKLSQTKYLFEKIKLMIGPSSPLVLDRKKIFQ